MKSNLGTGNMITKFDQDLIWYFYVAECERGMDS